MSTMSTTSPAPRRTSLPFDHPLHLQAHRFLVEEAHALDARDFDAWLAMLAPEVRYQVPVTSTTTRDGRSQKVGDMDHFAEDLYSLRIRVDRFRTNFAWAEDPPSRTRRFVSNVCTYASSSPNELHVRSYFLLFRSRGDLRGPDLLSGVREDVLLRDADGALLLLQRTATLDESVLRTQNLALFI
jgi:phthalate 3,4-dioxygenase beta subunit